MFPDTRWRCEVQLKITGIARHFASVYSISSVFGFYDPTSPTSRAEIENVSHGAPI